jgi:hypothetical protein
VKINKHIPGGYLALAASLLTFGAALVQSSLAGAFLIPAGFGCALAAIVRLENRLDRAQLRLARELRFNPPLQRVQRVLHALGSEHEPPDGWQDRLLAAIAAETGK